MDFTNQWDQPDHETHTTHVVRDWEVTEEDRTKTWAWVDFWTGGSACKIISYLYYLKLNLTTKN